MGYIGIWLVENQRAKNARTAKYVNRPLAEL
jgi:hypothetical protein